MSDVSAELAKANVHLTYLKEKITQVNDKLVELGRQLDTLNTQLTNHDFRIKQLESQTTKVRQFWSSNWFRLPAFIVATGGVLTFVFEEILKRPPH
jgi:septal ring factor EnvC (AmiA/AmiB activator)